MGKTTALDLHGAPIGLAAAVSNDADGFALARRLHTAAWVFDIDQQRVAYANQAACAFWNAKDEAELCSRDMGSDMSETVAKRLKQYQQDFQEGDPVFHEMWTLYPDGKPSSVMVYFRGFRLPDGRTGMLCEVSGAADDQPDNLRSVEALLHTDVMIALYEASGEPLYLNPAARGARTSDNANLQDMLQNPADFTTIMMELKMSGNFRTVAKTRTRQGERWHDLSAKTCLDAVTGEQAILVTSIDVSELKIARDTASYLADRDQLTGCFNRTYLQSHLAELNAQGQQPVCTLIYFDVDRFKLINDIHGHEAGDVVLKTITTRTLSAIRNTDLLVRLGGDEFVIILHQQSESRDILADVERIRLAISKPVQMTTSRVDLGVSLGVTQFLPGDVSFTTVMRQADLALYAAKTQGRGRSVLFDEEMWKAARARDELEFELKNALEARDFELYYQPRIDLRRNRVVSVEGLLRWNHKTKGVISPDTFIPICEETGLIEDLGQQVLQMGCKIARDWHLAGIDREVSLNISPRQFNDERLLSWLRNFSNQPGFPDGKIELEITENVLIGDPDEIAKKLRSITRLGYRIAIDDFGTGFSNLSYISRFPVHCIKVDRSFIDQLPSSAPIVSLILTLARQLGATIVAEGVETQAQLDWLSANSCDQVQGYLLSKPVPVSALERTIRGLQPSQPPNPPHQS